MRLLRMRDAVALCLGVLVFALACGDDNPVGPLEEGWYAMDLGESFVVDLEFAWPYLFAATAGDGLFRAKVSFSEPEWRLIGFAGETCNLVQLLRNGTLLVSSRKVIDEKIPLYSYGLYSSNDMGRTWTQMDSTGLLCVTSCCDALIGVRGGGEVYKSVDGGVSWWEISRIGFTGWSQIACHPDDCSFMLATPDRVRFSPLLVSHDGGETWSSATLSCPHGCSSPRGIAMDPKDKEVAYVGTLGAVLRTSDRGATWTPIIEPAEAPWFRAVIHDPIRANHVYAGGEGYVYVTPDAGNTVERIETPDDKPIWDLVCFGNRKMLFITTGAAVYRYVF
jgi:hypothetical protein